MDSSTTTTAKPSESSSSRQPVVFEIDLNEIPYSSSSTERHHEDPSIFTTTTCSPPLLDANEVVRSVHGNPRLPFRPPSDLPADVRGVPCVCGRAEARGGVLVCDGCDRWFHLSCCSMRSRQAIVLEDWICSSCLGNGVGTKRWNLGCVSNTVTVAIPPPPATNKRTAVRPLLDINASPPRDEDVEEFEPHSRMRTLGDTNFSGFSYGTPVKYPILWHPGARFDVQRESGINSHPIKLASERFVNNELNMSTSFDEADLNPTPMRRFRSTNSFNSPRRKEFARHSRTNSSADNREALRNSRSGDFSSDVEIVEPHASNLGRGARVKEAGQGENSGCESDRPNNGLPVQFEDLFLTCLGKVDSRPSYHDRSHIWPVGYRSSWHDKVTGSLFVCDVLDGGSSGPIFKVRRCPCSASVIPNASIVLLRQILGQSEAESKVESEIVILSDMSDTEDTDIQVLLSDPCPPEQDLLSCFAVSTLTESYCATKDILTPQANCTVQKSGGLFSNNLGLQDEVGEFFAEGRSSSSVWGKVSEMFVEACREAFKKFCSVKFYCTHESDGTNSLSVTDAKDRNGVGSPSKFCDMSGPRHIPRVIQSLDELEMMCKEVEKWLNQDRFGLDMEFVQEIIEQLPGSDTCSEYEFLTRRSDYSNFVVVGNGLLHAKRKGLFQGMEYEEAADGLFRNCRRLKQNMVQNLGTRRHFPHGKPLSSKLSTELVGDVLQVYELLWRFNDVLALRETLSFEELEGELINPWFHDSSFMEKLEKENQENRDLMLHNSHGMVGHNVAPGGEPNPIIFGDLSLKFIKVDTASEKEAAQAKLASHTYYRCTGVALTKVHRSLLNLLVGELQTKVAALVDPNFDAGESKSRRGRRKDADKLSSLRKLKIDMLPVNELTWPELARRYILAYLCMEGNLDSSEVSSREDIKVFRCLQGDGGMVCGSLAGVGGIKADALLLAEATKQIFGSLKGENHIWSMEYIDEVDAPETIVTESSNEIPEWAKVLEPARKLPTNVGTRIRKCVYEALDKGPPEWAKKILRHSISKEVYKGNASGPTKKAVVSVLTRVADEVSQRKPVVIKKERRVKTMSDIVMKQCRYVLRRTILEDEAKTFCNLLGTTSLNPNANEDDGILGYPAMVSRALDFRTIDLRLAVGTYEGSYEAFLEDVREVWHNIRTAYGDRPDLMLLAEQLSGNFESLYEKEVLDLVQKIKEHADSQCLSAALKKEIDEFLCGKEIPKAPWDDGVCRLCGIDKSDETVLLCDHCDSEYHTYCLIPPLLKIPIGNWYCPTCIESGEVKAPPDTHVIHHRRRKRYQGEGTRIFSETLNKLAAVMEEKEYWDCSLEERVFMLKFLSDEVLNSAIVREHLDQCAEMSADVQQKLRSFNIELRNLKYKEEVLTKESKVMLNGVGEAGKEAVATMLLNLTRGIGQHQTLNNSYNVCTPFCGMIQLGDVTEENDSNNVNNNSNWSFGKSNSGDHCNGSRNLSVLAADSDCQKTDGLSVQDDNLVLESLYPDKASKSSESNKHSEIQLPALPQKQVGDLRKELATESTMSEKHEVVTETTDYVQPMFEVLNEPRAYNLEVDSLKNEISRMENSIGGLESQLLKLSMRREFLGRDNAGRLYWVLNMPGKCPWLVVDGSAPVDSTPADAQSSNAKEQVLPGVEGSSLACGYEYHDGVLGFSSWVSYDSDVEIQELVGWLNSSDPRERELKESILQMHRLKSQSSQQAGNPILDDCQVTTGLRSFDGGKGGTSLATKASAILDTMYGLCMEPETSDIIPKRRGKKVKATYDDKIYRCECLELVWPSRPHCLTCHQTVSTNLELEGHNDGKCNSLSSANDESKETDDHTKGKGKVSINREEHACETSRIEASKSGKLDSSSRVIKFQKKEIVCPYNLEEIKKKFITNDSNKELVKGIGLIGSDGIPSLVPSTSLYLHDPTLVLNIAQREEAENGTRCNAMEVVSQQKNKTVSADKNPTDSAKRSAKNGLKEEQPRAKVSVSESSNKKDPASSKKNTPAPKGPCCVVPERSLRPVVGKVTPILRRLKSNLLDMDAALPEEALRPLKSDPLKRSAWRAFVKSAESIFEMIQAIIVFEDMIKTEYLKNSWYYWSSLSAAAKTSTISSLALRIYTLDANIIYQKSPSPDSDASLPTDPNPRLSKKRKDTEG
ncbi:hypothetical protein MKX01_001493 [Papaver californicum]|nr:hypothetical protein MKX01_001493 [Papaver californicum]